MAGNKALSKAQSAKRDEWYTQLIDIEKELRHYRPQFADQVVLCNCDDPYESNFFKYMTAKWGCRSRFSTSTARSSSRSLVTTAISRTRSPTTPRRVRTHRVGAASIQLTEMELSVGCTTAS